MRCGVRQGGVLSPQFFALFIDGVVKAVSSQRNGCYVHNVSVSIILYADDILLLAPSINTLQTLFSFCEAELHALGMTINERKSVCMRIGPRYQASCASIVTSAGKSLEWVSELRYLGVYFISACKFKCCFDNAKKSFYRSFNAIFGRVGRAASEEVLLFLIKCKCLPILLYGLDVCPVNATDKRSLEFTVNRILFKIFGTFNEEIIAECRSMFDFPTVQQLIACRKVTFLRKYVAIQNCICLLFAEEAQLECNAIEAAWAADV